jgi:IclR family pca regulon transcriptional regulator
MMDNEKEQSAYFVQSVAKGFEVLKAFDSSSTSLSLRELSERTGINKATVRRFALTLVDLGYLRLIEEIRFQLSPKVLDLAVHYLQSLNLPDLAQPILETISAKVKESTNLAILDGPEVVYVSRVNAAKRIVGVNLTVGSRLPYYATSLGKALVAWLPENERGKIWDISKIEAFTEKTITTYEKFEKELAKTRSQGYAMGDEELEEGLRSISMPIFNWQGAPIAAVNISTQVARTDEKKLIEIYLPTLQEGVKKLNQQAGFKS